MLPPTDQDYICQCHFCTCANLVDTKEGICWQCKNGAHEDALPDDFYVGGNERNSPVDEW